MSKNSTKTNEAKTESTVTEQQVAEQFNMDEAVKKLGSISAVIRDLSAKGHPRGTIAKMTGKRYQHVRNVLVTPVKKVAG